LRFLNFFRNIVHVWNFVGICCENWQKHNRHNQAKSAKSLQVLIENVFRKQFFWVASEPIN
jgi:hypothetical protein